MAEALKKQGRASAWFELLLDVITLVSFVVIIYHALYTFTSYDDIPAVISPSVPDLAAQSKDAPVVQTGLYIQDFTEFDIVNGKFLVDLKVWFKFDPKKIGLDKIDQFTFEKADIKAKSEPIITAEGDKLFVAYTMRVLFELPLNYRTFPFDDHTLSFTLFHEHLTPAQVKLESTSIVINPRVDITGWKIARTSARAGYYETNVVVGAVHQKEFHPRAVFSVQFARMSNRHLVSIFLPLLLIFFIALFSFTFAVKPEEADTINLVDISSASIFGIVAYRFVIETLSPSVGYFMLSDYIFVFFLLMTALIFVLNIFAEQFTSLQKNLIVLGLHVLANFFFIYFLIFWI